MGKPIKRSAQLVSFSREHHAGLLCCWKVRQGIRYQVSLKRVQQYIRYFWSEILATHFMEEEAILFILPGDSVIQQAMEDHVVIRDLASVISDDKEDVHKKDLERFAMRLEEHIRFEERILFPYLEQQLTDEQLTDIGGHTEAAAVVKDSYEDSFWLAPEK